MISAVFYVWSLIALHMCYKTPVFYCWFSVKPRTHICIATGAEKLRQCARVGPFNYTIAECPRDHIIHIRSAVIGFSPDWRSDQSHPHCSPIGATCVRIITGHRAIKSCHGSSSCLVPSTSNFLRYEPSCDGHRDANFINVIYDCVKPGKIKYCFMDFRSKDFLFTT